MSLDRGAGWFSSREERYLVARDLAQLLRVRAPEVLEVDEFGYAPVDAVLHDLRLRGFDINMDGLIEIVEKDAQGRFDIFRGNVRARAGHRFPVRPGPEPMASLPEYFYHGTSRNSVDGISRDGILRMGKAYVHLASTMARARRVGLRKSPDPAIFWVRARDAQSEGVRFWNSGQKAQDGEIILSDEVPPQFVVLEGGVEH